MPLFNDTILAFKYGPIIKSVYSKYKNYRYSEISEGVEDIYCSKSRRLPSKSRILFAENGVKKAYSIDETLKKYGRLSANRLVSITHRANTPWTLSGAGKEKNRVIEDDIIRKYHINEMI